MAHYSDVDAALGGVDQVVEALEPPRRPGLYRSHFKRALDVLVVLMAAPFILPVLFVLGLMILRDGGPILYSQERIGRGGKVFRLWKLRSMVVDADAKLEEHLASDPAARIEWNKHQKLRNDPRITATGRLIRKSSLDELPQLWNVLCGEMSLVGPRPMLPNQAALYPGLAYYRLRPGLTGFWQISDRNEVSFAGRAAHDAHYARRMSLSTDLMVLVATIWVVIRGTGY